MICPDNAKKNKTFQENKKWIFFRNFFCLKSEKFFQKNFFCQLEKIRNNFSPLFLCNHEKIVQKYLRIFSFLKILFRIKWSYAIISKITWSRSASNFFRIFSDSNIQKDQIMFCISMKLSDLAGFIYAFLLAQLISKTYQLVHEWYSMRKKY